MNPEFSVSLEEKKFLLDLAKSTVEQAARRIPVHRIVPPQPVPPRLARNGAAFVTLRKSAELRGCIGTVRTDKPLWQAVRDAAGSAAMEDTRFSPVTEGELKDISIEVSILSPLTEISSYEKFVPGQHGIMIEKGHSRGLFLPQVAADMGWGRAETLSALCRKAGLPMAAWKLPGARFWIFTTESFGLSDF